MKITHRRILLFVEPVRDAAAVPLNDAYTQRMTDELAACRVRGTINHDGSFAAGVGTLGVHTCVCGARSEAQDLALPNDYYTNSLAAHYLEFHRDEIRQTAPNEWTKVEEWFANTPPLSAAAVTQTMPQLRALAKTQGVTGCSKWTKEQLIQHLQL
jgi:hypothetical protein